jgi:hypothetical protein
MSSAVMERIAEERPKLDLISTKPAPKVQEEAGQWDLFLWPELSRSSCLSRSSVPILAWLALRHSGVMAP